MTTKSYWNLPRAKPYNYDTVTDRVRKRAEVYHDRTAFVERTLDGPRRTLNNQEFLTKSEKIAKYLVAAGVKRHDKVAIFGPNTLEWIIGEFGIIFAGAVSVYINIHTHDASDALEIIDISGCTFLLIDPSENDGANVLISKFKQQDVNHAILLLRKNENYKYHDLETELEAENSRESDLPTISPEDELVIFATSGSTGKPKLVTHTHFGFTCTVPPDTESPMTQAGISVAKSFSDRPFSWMGGSPITNFLHGFQLVFTTASVLLSSTDYAVKIWKMIKDEECTFGAFLPHQMQDLIDANDILADDNFRLPLLLTGGQIIDEAFPKKVFSKFSKGLLNGYGFTESSSAVSMLSLTEGQTYRTGCVGSINPGVELRIVDDLGEVVELEHQGEIQVRSKSLFKGYFGNEQLTTEAFTENGWFRTGDIGMLFEKGALFIVGRTKDVISRGSRKIMPAFIEEKINKMAGIKHVVVVGVPDDRLLEEVCACVVTTGEADVAPDDVEKFCKDVFLKDETEDGMGEMPKYFLCFDEFPSLHNGKVNKVEVKRLAIEKLNLKKT